MTAPEDLFSPGVIASNGDGDHDGDDREERDRLSRLFAVADDVITAGFDVLPAAVWIKPDGTLGKAPLLAHGHLGAHRDRQLIRQQLAAPPHVPEGVPAGFEVVVGFVPGSGGDAVFDADVKNGKAGDVALKGLIAEHGNFVTSAWRTPSGGTNVLGRKVPGASYGNTSPWPGIDVRADGGWCVAPGCSCAGGAWEWIGSSGFTTASVIPDAIAQQLRAPAPPGRRATNAETVAFIEASPVISTPAATAAFDVEVAKFAASTRGGRHAALVRIMSWAFGMHALNLCTAMEEIRAGWARLTAGEHREGEPDEFAAWVAGREIDQRAARTPPNVDPVTGEIRSTSPRNLPDEFWHRPELAAIRDAALRIDVPPEALMLAVCAAVAAHVPPAVRLPGPRLGTVDLIVCVVGPPGIGKGTVLDRAIETVPLPPGATIDRLGTSQGLVKRGYRPNPSPDAAERKRRPLVRHSGALVVRCDEISTFAARTHSGTPAGGDLLGTLKSAVSGEGLGGGYAGDDKNLPLEPGTYRIVGVIGVAPDKAAPLFGDLGGGFPERLLFADVRVDDADWTEVSAEEAAAAARALDPLVWDPPRPDGRQLFDTAPEILAKMHNRRRARSRSEESDPYAAHHDLLRHKLAAVLTYVDGRWTPGADDWRLAGMLMDVSVAARVRLLGDIAAETERTDRRRYQRVGETEVAKVRAVRADAEAERMTRLVDRARDLVEKVRAEPGISPADLRRTLHSDKREEFDPAFDHAVEMGWLVLSEEPGQGGLRRAVSLGTAKP